jgi:omega-6 fatty acid desaturase (delta-12 desaturase)
MEFKDSISAMIRKMPPLVLKREPIKAFGYLARDFVLVAIFASGILYVDSWLWGSILSIFLGMSLMGLFVLGHDAGHRSFAYNEKINNLVGHLTTTLCLWPFHVWRLSHDLHHRYTHNLDREIAWRPLTVNQYLRRSSFDRWFYRATRSYLMPISSFVFTGYFIRDALYGRKSKFFDQKDMGKLRLSIALCFIATAVVIFGSYALAGIYGLIYLFVVPQIIFQTLLSVFTFFHHTAPDRTLHSDVTWTMEKGQIGGTVHVKYPGIIEWFCHDINWHVPHHVCVGIPHYHLRLAHISLKKAYSDGVKEIVLNRSTWNEVTEACHLVKGKGPGEETWVTFSEASQIERQLKPATV